ncbi:MAG: hypothetical protein QOK15_3954 [Nocardioidaceae bacterium]|nr:hypothetical protein [Nocardioidaceae bacterium]
MTVLMTLRVHANTKSVENEDKDLLRSIVEKGKQHGVISHRFYGTDDEILVVDEWPDEESFQRFYADAPEIGGMMERAGVTAAPEITFWRHLDTGDDVG